MNKRIVPRRSDGRRNKLVRAAGILTSAAVEGACDFHCGRPFDANPFSRENAPEAWASWRAGWLEAASYERMRGDKERRRWLVGPESAEVSRDDLESENGGDERR